MNAQIVNKPKVLIGSLSDGADGPIPIVTKAFIRGLGDRYEFLPHVANRRYGKTLHARLHPLNLWYLLKHLSSWVRVLMVRRPDIAHYPVTSFWNLEKSMMFLGIARMFGAKTIGHLHGGSFIEFWRSLPEYRRRRSSRNLNRLDAFIVLSVGWKERVVRDIGLPESKVFVVNNPIDEEFEERMLAAPLRRSTRSILAFGIMSRYKGVFDMLEAWRQLEQRDGFILFLIGPEREKDVLLRCREKIEEFGMAESVSLSDGAWGEFKSQCFEEASIFMLPSYRENLPLVVLEAAAAGLPIIATPVGALPEFFDDGKSIVFVQAGNVGQIRNALQCLIADEPARLRLGTAAREVFTTKFARAGIMASLDGVYRHVLGMN